MSSLPSAVHRFNRTRRVRQSSSCIECPLRKDPAGGVQNATGCQLPEVHGAVGQTTRRCCGPSKMILDSGATSDSYKLCFYWPIERITPDTIKNPFLENQYTYMYVGIFIKTTSCQLVFKIAIQYCYGFSSIYIYLSIYLSYSISLLSCSIFLLFIVASP